MTLDERFAGSSSAAVGPAFRFAELAQLSATLTAETAGGLTIAASGTRAGAGTGVGIAAPVAGLEQRVMPMFFCGRTLLIVKHHSPPLRSASTVNLAYGNT